MRTILNLFSLLVFALVFSACGKAPAESSAPVLSLGSYSDYVTRFENASKAAGKPVTVTNLVIQEGKMESPYENGACTVTEGQPPTITIKASAWALLTEPEREELIFHELGHCVLGRVHNSTMDGSGDPVSLMNPYPIGPVTYSSHRADYLVELFK